MTAKVGCRCETYAAPGFLQSTERQNGERWICPRCFQAWILVGAEWIAVKPSRKKDPLRGPDRVSLPTHEEVPTMTPSAPTPTTALATIPHGLPFSEDEWTALSPTEQQEAIAFFRSEVAATTEGVQVQFPTVRFPTSGSSFFEIPTITGEPEAVKEIEGTVVFKMPKRAFWATDEISNTPPSCSSRDGITPIDGPDKQAVTCAVCPHSKFGTATKGHGQRCKMRLDLFLVRPGDEIPTRMSLPPTGIKPFGAYAVGLRQKKSALIAVTTIISLQDAKNQDGVSYKAPTFRIGTPLTFAEMKSARALSDAFENAMAERGITIEDTADEPKDGVVEPY